MRLGLRGKLLLAASAMCLVPLAGYHYLGKARVAMSTAQENATHSVARSIARLVDVTAGASLRTRPRAPAPYLYLPPLVNEPEMDGYLSDWAELAPSAPFDHAEIRAGSAAQRVYLLIVIPPGAASKNASVVLLMQDSPEFVSTWRLPLSGHGRSAVQEISPAKYATPQGYPDSRFTAALRRSSLGTVVEIGFPQALLTSQLALALGETLEPDAPRVALLPPRGMFSVITPHAQLQRLIIDLAGPGRRIWVLDALGHVLARDGELKLPPTHGVLSGLAELFLPVADDGHLTLIPATGRIEAPELTRVLAGEDALRWRRASGDDERVVSAAVPIRRTTESQASTATDVRGAIVVEDAVQALHGLHTRGLMALTLSTLTAFLVASLILFAVSARMIARLRSLRDQAAQAIDSKGRILGDFNALTGGDEIGDLGRSFTSAMVRIRGYNSYLEQLAKRLSHELRTPVTIVRSSLENLALTANLEERDRTYLQRAQDGVRRLDGMISRMTEAARLEQAVWDDEREVLTLAELLDAGVKANAASFNETPLRLIQTDPTMRVRVSPNLILQALDKLLANARDFCTGNTEVIVRSERATGSARISVCNTGPLLDSETRAHMFESMFSAHRAGTDDGQVHLGLGLHVVRLIAQGHGGDTFAVNIDDDSGVCIGFTIPTLGD